jgi:hypothetical protein
MPPYKTLALALLLACTGVAAQFLPESADWRESAVPPPPAFDVKRLIRLESPKGSTLTFGIDPATLSITPEGIVRYVIVATGQGGGQNVMYEGIRCSAGQHRVYARFSAKDGWSAISGGEWQPLYGSAASRHAVILAEAGACKDRAVNRSVSTIVRALKGELPAGYD